MPQPYLRNKIYSIYKPSLGLVRNEPSSILNPRASRVSNNVRYEDGIVKKRNGYGDYGSGTITGVPLKFYNYNGTRMLATTTNIYWMDDSTWTSIATTIGCTIDNRITMNTFYDSDTFYCVWGSKNYLAKKWDGTTVTALATDVSTWKPKVIVPYQFRLLMFNIDVGGTDKPIRMSYSAANDISDWTTASVTGSRNLIQGAGSEILNAVPINNYLGIYKDRSITLLSYVGGDSIFATQVKVDGIGLMAQDAIVNLGTKHIFLGNDYNIYQWEGGGELIPIGDKIKWHIKRDIDRSNRGRCFATYSNEEREVYFFVPGQNEDYATIYYTYNWDNQSWSRNTITATSGAGEIKSDDDDELTMIGLSTGGTEWMYSGGNNDDGAAINAYFETPDIIINDEEHIAQQTDYVGAHIEAIGTTINFEYSLDGGENWSTAETKTLNSTTYYDIYDFWFTKTSRMIRFRFGSTAVDTSWAIRWIELEYKDRERKLWH